MAESALKARPERMTLAAFLEWEDGTDTRYELIDGMPVAMALELLVHGEIMVRLGMAIGNRGARRCPLMIRAALAPPGRADTVYLADLVVSRAMPTRNEQIVREPKVIFEVLSPSTAVFDRGTKAEDYRAIPSVREIVLVSSTEPKIQLWQRDDAGWRLEDLTGPEATLVLPSLEMSIPLQEIFGGIDFAALRGAAAPS